MPHKLKSGNPEFIDKVVRALSSATDLTSGLNMLLKSIVAMTRAERGTIYRLHIDKSKYLPHILYNRRANSFEVPASNGINAEILLERSISNRSTLETAIVTRSVVSTSLDSTDKGVSEMFIPILRGRSCLAVLSLEFSAPTFLQSAGNYDVEVACAAIVAMFERQSNLEFLKVVQQLPDFTKPLEDFLDDLLLLAADSSKMPLIQIHELDDSKRALHCIAQFGFRQTALRHFDVDPLTAIPAFSTALERGRAIVESGIERPENTQIRSPIELRRMVSFVVLPIHVGRDIFGTLALGASWPFDYSPSDVARFEIIASTIGSAITTSRNARQLRDISVADMRLGLSISAVEIAQAARHEVRGVVDDCQARLATVKSYLRAPLQNQPQIEMAIDEVGEQLLRITSALDKIKDASFGSDEKLQYASLKEIWKEAGGLVAAKLEQERIRLQITGKDLRARVLTSSLRHAFLHLLLNSIDAFRERPFKGARIITVSIDPENDAENDSADRIKILYTDNAGGIDPGAFEGQLRLDRSRDVKDLIFDKGVTTKPTGSGYGLYLTRTIFNRHQGEIKLLSYKGGVLFEMSLPRALRTRTDTLATRPTPWFAKPNQPIALVVEDQPRSRETRINLLNEYGFTVFSADTARKALEIIRSVPSIDIVVTDINLDSKSLADKSGVSLAQLIRAEDSNIPIIGYSALFSDRDLGARELLPFDDYLPKGSASVGELLKHVERWRERALEHRKRRSSAANKQLEYLHTKYESTRPDFVPLSAETFRGSGYRLRIINPGSDKLGGLRMTIKSPLVVRLRREGDVTVAEVFGRSDLSSLGDSEDKAIAGLLRSMSKYHQKLVLDSESDEKSGGDSRGLRDFLRRILGPGPESTRN